MNEPGRIRHRLNALKGDRNKMHKTMTEFGQGELHSGSKHGPVVQDRKQAIAIGLKQSGQSREGVEDQPRDEMGKWTAGQHAEHLQKIGDEGIEAMRGAIAKKSKKPLEYEEHEKHKSRIEEHVTKAKKLLHPKYHKQLDKAKGEQFDRFGSFLRAHA